LVSLDEPQLFLVLSVDISGSTRFKSSGQPHWGSALPESEKPAVGDSTTVKLPILPWVETFLLFYDRFKDVLWSHYASDAARPRLWKILGDELLFYAPICDCGEALKHVSYFLKTVRSEDARLREASRDLGLKATGWVAGFPVNNFMLVRNPVVHGGQVYADGGDALDFIGPQVDLGFRIAKLSTRQKFVVSHDLALVLCHAGNPKAFRFHYGGRQEIRGLDFDGGYPVIWVESVLNNIDKEDLALCGDRQVEVERTIELVDAFIDAHPHRLHRPFMRNDAQLGEQPAGYGSRLDLARGLIRKTYSIADDDVAAAAVTPLEHEKFEVRILKKRTRK
jgi:hypothetical protein